MSVDMVCGILIGMGLWAIVRGLGEECGAAMARAAERRDGTRSIELGGDAPEGRP